MAKYNLDRYDSRNVSIVVDDTSTITQSGLTWVGQYYSRFGEILLENILHVAENFSGPNAPGHLDDETASFNVMDGQLWFSTGNEFQNTKILKIQNGNTSTDTDGWKRLEPIITNDEPTVHTEGEMWYDPSDRTFSFSRNNRWEDVSVKMAHNASALDGVKGSQFLRKDIDDTMSGTLYARNIYPSSSTQYDLGNENALWKTLYLDILDTNYTKDLEPLDNRTYNLGSRTRRWESIYVSFIDALSYGDLLPNIDSTFTLGTREFKWQNLFVNHAYIGDIKEVIPMDSEGTIGTTSKRWPTAYFTTLDTVNSKDLIPLTTNTYNLGSSTKLWKELYVNVIKSTSTEKLQPVTNNTFDIGTSTAKYNNLYFNAIGNDIASKGNITFDIVKNSSSKGLVWTGLSDTHKIYVREIANNETSQLVINTSDNADDCTVFVNGISSSTSNPEKDVMYVRRNEVDARVNIKAKEGVKVEASTQETGVNMVYNPTLGCLEFKFY